MRNTFEARLPSILWLAGQPRPEHRGEVYERLRSAYGEAFRDPSGVYVVLGYRAAIAALSNNEALSSDFHLADKLPRTVSNLLGPILDIASSAPMFIDDPRHREIRQSLAPPLRPNLVNQLADIVLSTSKKLLQRCSDKGQFDLVNDYARLLPFGVISTLLGIPQSDRSKLQTIADRASLFLARPLALSSIISMPTVMRDARRLDTYFQRLIDQHMQESGGQTLLIDSIARHYERVGHKGSFGAYVASMLAGYRTTMTAIGNTMFALMSNPEQRELIQSNKVPVAAAVKESFRYDSPIQIVLRRSTMSVKIGGQVVPAGKPVLVVIGAANRDPEVFPGGFDVKRFLTPEGSLATSRDMPGHIAFGNGIHVCPGAYMSEWETNLAITDLFQHLPKLQIQQQSNIHTNGSHIFSGLKSLPVDALGVGRNANSNLITTLA